MLYWNWLLSFRLIKPMNCLLFLAVCCYENGGQDNTCKATSARLCVENSFQACMFTPVFMPRLSSFRVQMPATSPTKDGKFDYVQREWGEKLLPSSLPLLMEGGTGVMYIGIISAREYHFDLDP